MASSTSETRPAQPPSVKEDMEFDPGPVVLTGPDDLLAPEGSVNPNAIEGVVDLMSHEEEIPSSPMGPVDAEPRLPWYRTPSPWWMLSMAFIGALAMGAIIAPRLEILNRLVCHELRPEYIAVDPPLPPDAGWWWLKPQIRFYPGKSKQCMADPVVQAAVAQLLTGITVTTGVISCFVGGWWGQFSDRHGRKSVLAITVLGAISTDLTMFLLSYAIDFLPGGYRFLLVPAVIDGVVGGVTAAAAASHAYISDSVPPAARSRYLAFSLGLLFSGITLGPTLGAFLISATDNLLAVYYVSLTAHITFFLMAALIIPESLPAAARANNVAKQQRDHAQEQRRRREEIEQERHGNGMSDMERRSRQMSRFFKDVLFFLQPLKLFIPSSDGKGGKDRNLTLIAICSACGGIIIGSYTYKIQYANLAFGWTSTEMAYYVSLLAFARAAFLVAILPAFLKFFGPKPEPAVALPIAPNEPLQDRSSSPPRQPTAINEGHSQTIRHHTASFDLKFAQISLLIEVIAFAATAAVLDPMWWAAATIFGAFGGGFGPALQSLAVELHKGDRSTNEVGRLFGALGVLQALCSQIIGPSVFGLTFMSTVETFPRAIFILSACVQAISFTSISLVRLPQPTLPDAEQATPSNNGESPS